MTPAALSILLVHSKGGLGAEGKPDTISKGLRELGCETNEEAVSKLSSYLELVVRWNKRINLVSKKDIDRLLERHLFDSLSIERFIKGDRALDIGSGGAFQEFLWLFVGPICTLLCLIGRPKKSSFF